MSRGRGGRVQGVVVALALAVLGALALTVPALGAGDPPPVPKPDPPPKVVPPPPPQAPRPPAPQPAAPPRFVPPAVTAPARPALVHPTAAERRTAARRRAKRKAARVARAKQRIASTKLAAAHRRERARNVLAAGDDARSSTFAMPFLLLALGGATLLLGLALTPAAVVPWDRASRALEDRREELGILGAMGLVATLVFFLLVQVTN